MYSEKFAKQLKELIGSRSISSVAKEIGIPQATLSRYILCQREIGIENLCKIANYFNEDLDILTGRKEFWLLVLPCHSERSEESDCPKRKPKTV